MVSHVQTSCQNHSLGTIAANAKAISRQARIRHDVYFSQAGSCAITAWTVWCCTTAIAFERLGIRRFALNSLQNEKHESNLQLRIANL